MYALGTEVMISGQGAEGAWEELEQLEATLTRFKPSKLTELNQQGSLNHPPEVLLEAVEHALEIAKSTHGLVTPLILPALKWAGYKECFQAAQVEAGLPPDVADWADVELSGELIRLPQGAELDLGGTAKSWIVERISRHLSGNFVIDAGGDVWLKREELSPIDLEHPFAGESCQLLLPPGQFGIATSSLLKRAWRGGHHLIDPRTSRPLSSRWVQVTAIGPSLCTAEVMTKLIFLGAEESLEKGYVYLAFDQQGQLWRYEESWYLV
ncbi:MAG: FAD:protein FMN transferase [Trueperaceae bacterium]|nr:FAD:protein FMN transferase [Trueperaceae bacterium]